MFHNCGILEGLGTLNPKPSSRAPDAKKEQFLQDESELENSVDEARERS